MKFKPKGLIIVLLVLSGCVSNTNTKQVKIYKDGLKSMLGKAQKDVIPTIRDSWKYQLLYSWKAEDPSIETVLKLNYRISGFSEKEAKEIFSSKGKYKVMIYLKPLNMDLKSVGQVETLTKPNTPSTPDRIPRSGGWSSYPCRAYQIPRYSSIRLVFKNNKLAHFSFWVII